MEHPLVLPMLIQMSLAIIILFIMAPRRLIAVSKAGSPAKLREAGGFTQSLVNMGDNFKNQFEMPVIFYALCILFIIDQSTNQSVVIAAWVFVVMRILHAIVQCTNNKIFPNRFGVFLISALSIIYMVGVAFGQILASAG